MRSAESRRGAWRTSSYSTSGGRNCVEVAALLGHNTGYAIRDSKNRARGHHTISSREWTVLLGAVKRGEM